MKPNSQTPIARRKIYFKQATLLFEKGKQLNFSNATELSLTVDYWIRAANLCSVSPDFSYHEAEILWYLGELFKSIGSYDSAIKHYTQSLNLVRRLELMSTETVAVINSIGQVYLSKQDYNIAIEFLTEAYTLVSQFDPDSDLAATILSNTAAAFFRQNRLPEAEKLLRQATLIDMKAKRMSSSAAARSSDLGDLLVRSGKLQESLKFLNFSKTLNEKLDPVSKETANDYSNISLVYKTLGQLDEALKYANQALEIDTFLNGNSKDSARDFRDIGAIYYEFGNLSEALTYYQKALSIDELIDACSSETAMNLDLMGSVYMDQSSFALALEHYEKALDIDQSIDPQSAAVATHLNNIGRVHQLIGNNRKARDSFNKAIAIDRITKNVSINAATRKSNIGGLYLDEGCLGQALKNFSRAHRMIKKIAPNSKECARYLNNIGGVYTELGKFNRALEYYKRALKIDEKVAPESSSLARDISNIASVFVEMGNYNQALTFTRNALEKQSKVDPNSIDTSTCLANLGSIHLYRGEIDLAAIRFEQAIDLIESARSRASHMHDGKIGFLDKNIDVYGALINVLAQKKEPEKAFSFAERSRARSLVEMLTEQSVDRQIGASPKLLELERTLNHQIASTYSKWLKLKSSGTSDENEVKILETNLHNLEERLAEVIKQIRDQNPKYAQLQYPTPIGLEATQKMIKSRDEAFLEYFVDNSNSFLWVISAGQSVFIPLGIKLQVLNDIVLDQFRQYFVLNSARDHENSEDSFVLVAEQLYSMIFRPAEQFLEGIERLIISPDGPLNYLPFEALICDVRSSDLPEVFNNREFLCERFVISYTPSATTLHNLRLSSNQIDKSTVEYEFVGFGDPDYDANLDIAFRQAKNSIDPEVLDERVMSLTRIPASGREVLSIFNLFSKSDSGRQISKNGFVLTSSKAKVYLQYEATEKRARLNTNNYRYVHFATHGMVDELNPMRSSIVFSPTSAANDDDDNWLLQPHAILGMTLNAELVTLSACETGLGQITRGEGLIGMTRAFMYAGTPSVVVSLWGVDDEATSYLMTKFYSYLIDGIDKTTSLTMAKRVMLNKPSNPEYRNPYFWAPFVLQGLPD